MSKRIFTKEQIEELLQNTYVAACSDKSISFTKGFKVMAVRQYQEGLSARVIFKQVGINISLIGQKTPKWCLERWHESFKKKGEAGLRFDGRGSHKSGGRPKVNWSDDAEKLKYLEAQVAYLKAENAFLAKLRKQRLN